MARKQLTTAKAFEHLLSRPYLWQRTGRPMQQLFSYRNKLKKGITIRRDTQEKMLNEAGYTVVKETTWRFPW